MRASIRIGADSFRGNALTLQMRDCTSNRIHRERKVPQAARFRSAGASWRRWETEQLKANATAFEIALPGLSIGTPILVDDAKSELLCIESLRRTVVAADDRYVVDA